MSPQRLLIPNHHQPNPLSHGSQRKLPTGKLVGHKACGPSFPDNASSRSEGPSDGLRMCSGARIVIEKGSLRSNLWIADELFLLPDKQVLMGWRLLMLLQSKFCVKCELSKVSHFQRERHYLFGRRRWGFSKQPSSPHFHDIKVQRLQYNTMSSQTINKEEKDDLGFSENSRQLPFAHSYEAAMDALSSLISRQKRSDQSSVGGKYGKLERMAMYLKILGLEEKIQDLKIIHVAGTKGKGSTCAFCEAILRECGFRTGLFISPHLIDVCERFRLDGLDISRDKFLMYFWDCWSILKEKISEDLPMPPLFQFLTLLAFKMFLSEKVDVAIIEVGLGGRNDTTNVIKEPVVCGIASLGMDHTEILGDTIGKIASHKAGIFKPHVPAFTVPQLSEAMDVLQEKAAELMVPLNVADPLDDQRWEGLTLGLSGDHQFVNAGLAVSLCKCWLQRTGNWDYLFEKVDEDSESVMPAAFLRGLSTARLSGRAQIVHDAPSTIDHLMEFSENVSGELIFYLDGAHSPESMEACARWFSNAVTVDRGPSHLSTSSAVDKLCSDFHLERKPKEETDRMSKQILLFNCMDVRDPDILLPQLVNICASSGTHFSKALFVPSMSTYNKVTSGDSIISPDIPSQNLSWQLHLQKLWEKVIHGKDLLPEKNSGADCVSGLLPHDIIYKDISHCNPAEGHFACSAVIPSLPLTIKWLRDCVRENPSLRLQVLVTGSLHLVGDVLKLLRR